MSGIDETQIKPEGLGHLLSDSNFVVPPYQRPYSWQPAHVDQFMVDILDSFNDDNQKEYFLGTIVLIDNDGGYSIVDGQQRLATLSLLLAAIKDYMIRDRETKRANRINEDYLVKEDIDLTLVAHLTLNGLDDPYFSKLTQNTKHKISKTDPKSAQNMANAAKVINEHVDAFVKSASDPIALLTKLVKYIDRNLLVIKIVVTDESNAFTIFETLNDRGLELSVADLLKNHLFSYAGPDGIEAAKTYWTTIQGTLNTVGDDTMLPTFIRHYWISKYEAATQNDLFKKIKKRIHTKAEALALLKELSDSSKDYAALQNPQHERWRKHGAATEESVKTLNSLRFEQTKPLLLSILRNFNDNQLPKVLEKMVHWSVRIQVAGNTRTGQFSEHLKNVIDSINAAGSTVRTAAKLGQKLESEGLIPSNKIFAEAFELVTPRIALARYYLMEIENVRRKAAGGTGELKPDGSPNNVNLEHILPVSIDTPTDWPNFTADQASEYHSRLGNMVLMQSKKNSSIGNLPFSQKKVAFSQSDIMTTADIGTISDWDVAAIESRQEELAKLATKAWPIK